MTEPAWTAVGSGLAALVAAVFSAVVLARRRRRADALWGVGLGFYAGAAALEAAAWAFGWGPVAYRAYLVLASTTVALLGLGTVALLRSPALTRIGSGLVAALSILLVVGIALAPLDVAGAPHDVGADLVPFPHPARVAFLLLNVLGGLALVLGALASGWRTRRPGVLLIGAGAALPFVGGTLSALDVAPARVVLQVAGIVLMAAGYLLGRRASPAAGLLAEAA